MRTETVKRIASNLLLLLVFSVGAYGVAEVTVRLLFKDSIILFPRYHTDAQYGEYTLRTIRPNTVFWHTSVDGSWRFETNAQGFRNVEDFAYEKPAGVFRVLAIGDSNTQGYEVRQDFTFSATIEKYLDARGFDAQVLNTGVSGFSTAEELLFLENEGVKYSPDAVVLAFYANDFEDNIKAGLFRLHDDGSLTVEKKAHLPGVRVQNLIYSVPMVAWLGENSYFYSILFNGVWEFFKTKLSNDAAAAVAEYAIPTVERNSNYEVELTAALLRRMYTFCRERDIKLIVLDLPRLNGKSSFAPSILAEMPMQSDAYIDGSALMADYFGVADVHLPHGNRHISELTHAILGVAAAKRIEAWRAEGAASGSHDDHSHR